MQELSFSISNGSPIIRRAASKPSLFASDDDEKIFLRNESIDTKGLTVSTHAAVIMPSPIFLRRFKVTLFFFWGVWCCMISWDSVMRMSVDLRKSFLHEAFLYYNPLLLITLTVWLWGVNLWVFSQSSVNYVRVFELAHSHLTHREIWKCATWMTIVVTTSMTAYLYLYSHGEVSLAASQPVILYAALLMLLILPFNIFYSSSRYFLLRTFCRIVLPLQAITFPDFFVADILTSLSKVFSDLERSTCRMVNRKVATIAWFEGDSICGSHSLAIPIVLVFPYLCRFVQCLRQYNDTKEKTCLFNALKYSTVIPVICLSALKYHVLLENWVVFYRPLWLISSVINSLYSFYWDITRDWDLSILSRIFLFKNQGLLTRYLYGRSWVYYWALGTNLILRCTWTYKLSAHLRHNHLTVFAITALEIVRRFQWIFFRVENEWSRTIQKHILELSESFREEEEDRLLGSASHNV